MTPLPARIKSPLEIVEEKRQKPFTVVRVDLPEWYWDGVAKSVQALMEQGFNLSEEVLNLDGLSFQVQKAGRICRVEYRYWEDASGGWKPDTGINCVLVRKNNVGTKYQSTDSRFCSLGKLAVELDRFLTGS